MIKINIGGKITAKEIMTLANLQKKCEFSNFSYKILNKTVIEQRNYNLAGVLHLFLFNLNVNF